MSNTAQLTFSTQMQPREAPPGLPRPWRQRLHGFLEKQKAYFPWYYGGLITLAELLTAFGFIPEGLALHLAILCLLILHAAFTANKASYPFYITLAIAPLIRVLSLTMPLGTFPLIWWYAITNLPLMAVTWMIASMAGLKPKDIGFTMGRRLWLQLLIGLVGLPLGIIEYLILSPQPLIPELTPRLLAMPALILFFFTGFNEEVIFRGVMQRAGTKSFGPRFGLYYTAFIFTILHVTHQSVLDVFFVFIVAYFFGRFVQEENSLLGVIIAHGFTNIGLYLVWPFVFIH